MCNGLIPTLLSISYGVLAGCVDVPLGLNPSMEHWKAQGMTALMGAFLVGALVVGLQEVVSEHQSCRRGITCLDRRCTMAMACSDCSGAVSRQKSMFCSHSEAFH